MSGSGIKGKPAMLNYLDHVESWASNEVTINWNAPLAWLTAFLDAEGPKIGEVVVSPSPSGTTGNIRDINEDGAINMADVMLVAEVFNTSSSSSKYVAKRDINKDGAINMADVMLIAEKFNTVVY
jgi:endoglucanase